MGNSQARTKKLEALVDEIRRTATNSSDLMNYYDPYFSKYEYLNRQLHDRKNIVNAMQELTSSIDKYLEYAGGHVSNTSRSLLQKISNDLKMMKTCFSKAVMLQDPRVVCTPEDMQIEKIVRDHDALMLDLVYIIQYLPSPREPKQKGVLNRLGNLVYDYKYPELVILSFGITAFLFARCFLKTK